jgi:hypothetical protein
MTRSTTIFLALLWSVPVPACDLDLPNSEGDEGAGDDEPAEPDDDEPADPDDDAAPIPEGLLGLWIITGTTSGSLFEFVDDGTYVRANIGETSFGTCTTAVEMQSAGEYTVDGDTISLVPRDAYKRIDDCGTVTESDELPDAEDLVWSLEHDEWGEALVLTDSTGYAAVYHRG